jgi:hypothetical protein
MKCDPLLSSSSRLIAALGFLGVSLCSGVGHAVPPEYLRSIALHPTDPQAFALRYESAFGGLFFSRDGGHSLQMVPGQSFYKYDLRRFVPMLFASDGKLLLALDSGLDVDNGAGCFPAVPTDGSSGHYSEPAVAGLWVADLAPHPSDPDTTFLITTADPKDKGHTGLWKRDKQGKITPIGASEPAPTMPNRYPFLATGLKVVARTASMEGVRFIVTGTATDYSGATPSSAPVLRISDNLGMSWTSHPIPDPNKTGGNARLLLVDGSSDPFKALVFLENGFGEDSDDALDPIFITKDGAQSFTPYLDKVQVAGEVVRLPSGQILIADRGVQGGLWSAANFDAAPTKIADYSVHCLAYQPQTQKLLMCKLNELGYFDVASNTFCEIFKPSDTTAFVSCQAAPLEQNQAGIKQLCGGFCGAAHYSSAPVCSTFTVPPATNLCGPAAHAYDNEGADPDKHWIEPPGSGAAPRCAGFTGPVLAPDAGVPTNDAGVSDPGGSDAGRSDAGVDEVDAGSEGGGGAGEDAGTPKKKPSGCQLSAAHDPRSGQLAAFLLALWFGFAIRRSRRVSLARSDARSR